MDDVMRETESLPPGLLARYQEGLCSALETERVETWIEAVPGRAASVSQVERMIAIGQQDRPKVNIDAFWTQLANRLEKDGRAVDEALLNQSVGNDVGRGITPSRQTRAWISWLAGGLCVMLAAMGGLTLWNQHRPSGDVLVGKISIASAPVTSYTTHNKHLAHIILPDGSTVTLNAASRIEVPLDFATTRTVRLTGEALFTVVHQGENPFVVVTGNTTTRVLGTSFVVRRYDDDTTVVVTVRDGKVAVGTSVVAASQRAQVFNSGDVQLDEADASSFTFVRGVLTIKGVPLRDAIRDLNRWYDADIRIAGHDESLADQLVSGAFTAGPTSDLVSILSFMFDIRVEQQGRVLTLYSKQT